MSPAARPDSPPLVVGKIAGRYGVHGWLKIHSFTRPVAQILGYDRWMLAARVDTSQWRAVGVAEVAQQPKKLLAKLSGVDGREAAAQLFGQWIAIEASQLAQLPHGEYYWSDLIGLTVVNQDDIELGVVECLLETGANDVLVVRAATASGNPPAERLLPWCDPVIARVDAAGRRLHVRWHADD